MKSSGGDRISLEQSFLGKSGITITEVVGENKKQPLRLEDSVVTITLVTEGDIKCEQMRVKLTDSRIGDKAIEGVEKINRKDKHQHISTAPTGSSWRGASSRNMANIPEISEEVRFTRNGRGVPQGSLSNGVETAAQSIQNDNQDYASVISRGLNNSKVANALLNYASVNNGRKSFKGFTPAAMMEIYLVIDKKSARLFNLMQRGQKRLRADVMSALKSVNGTIKLTKSPAACLTVKNLEREKKSRSSVDHLKSSIEHGKDLKNRKNAVFGVVGKEPEKYNALLNLGWKRKVAVNLGKSGLDKYTVCYYSPDGQKLTSPAEVTCFLQKNPHLPITDDHFSFFGIRPNNNFEATVMQQAIQQNLGSNPDRNERCGPTQAQTSFPSSKSHTRKRQRTLPESRMKMGLLPPKFPKGMDAKLDAHGTAGLMAKLSKNNSSPVEASVSVHTVSSIKTEDNPLFQISTLQQNGCIDLNSLKNYAKNSTCANDVNETEQVNRVAIFCGKEKRQQVVPCSVRCPAKLGSMPELQCTLCLFYYHSVCLRLPANMTYLCFLCPNCHMRTSKYISHAVENNIRNIVAPRLRNVLPTKMKSSLDIQSYSKMTVTDNIGSYPSPNVQQLLPAYEGVHHGQSGAVSSNLASVNDIPVGVASKSKKKANNKPRISTGTEVALYNPHHVQNLQANGLQQVQESNGQYSLVPFSSCAMSWQCLIDQNSSRIPLGPGTIPAIPQSANVKIVKIGSRELHLCPVKQTNKSSSR